MKRKWLNIFTFLVAIFCMTVGFASWSYGNNYIDKTTDIKKDTSKVPVAYIIGKKDKYTTIEKALEVAQSGDVVTVFPGKLPNYDNYENLNINPDRVEYTISNNCTIKDGVTFLIPTDKANLDTVLPNDNNSLTTYITNMRKDQRTLGNIKDSTSLSLYKNFAEDKESRYLRTVINVADGVTINNNGKLIVSGYLTGGDSGPGNVGQTGFSYSQIVLGKNSKIIQNNSKAETHCYGYIRESTENNGSQFDINRGLFYVPLILNDYHGFTNSYAMTDGAINKERIPPFNLFEIRNIQCLTNVFYNAKVVGVANVYALFESAIASINEVFFEMIDFIGSANSCLLQFSDAANEQYYKISYNFNKSTKVSTVKFYGGLKLNNLSINISKAGITIPLSTKDAFFPMSYKFEIELFAGNHQTNAVYDNTIQRVKLMPGCKFTLHPSVTLKASEMSVYTAFYDASTYSARNYGRYYSANYPLKDGAELKLENGARLEANFLGGTVYSAPNQVVATTKTVVSKELWTQSFNSSNKTKPWTFNNFLIINEKLNVVPLENLTKYKLYAGLNIYTVYSGFKPKFNIHFDDITDNPILVSEYQQVIFRDHKPQSYKIEFLNNIYNFYYGDRYYSMHSKIAYSDSNNKVDAVCTDLAVSASEFEVKKVTVTPTTALINDQLPLFVDGKINLKAVVTDINKSYSRSISWKSSDPSIASVDSNGDVTGHKLGGPVTITATCGGKSGTYPVTVINESDLQMNQLEAIRIVSSSGGSSKTINGEFHSGSGQVETTSGKPYYFNEILKKNKDITMTLQLTPSNANISSITWSFSSNDRVIMYDTDPNSRTNVVNEKTSVHIKSLQDGGLDPDLRRLTVSVVPLKGTKLTEEFYMHHNGFNAFTLPTEYGGRRKPPKVTKPAKITIDNKPAKIMLNVGQTNTLTLSFTKPINPSDSTLGLATRVAWISSNPAVATVDQNGLIEAVKAGTTTIRVVSLASSLISDSVTVQVS